MSKLALLVGTPNSSKPYPQWPVFDDRDIAAVTAVIRSGQLGGFPYPGPQFNDFILRFFRAVQPGGLEHARFRASRGNANRSGWTSASSGPDRRG